MDFPGWQRGMQKESVNWNKPITGTGLIEKIRMIRRTDPMIPVGNNRPDIQYDKNGVHTNVEYDTRKFSSNKHKKTLEKNDPNAKNEFYLIK